MKFKVKTNVIATKTIHLTLKEHDRLEDNMVYISNTLFSLQEYGTTMDDWECVWTTFHEIREALGLPDWANLKR